MRIIVKAVTRSRQRKVEKIDEGSYKVWVTAVPEKGKANDEIVEVLADYFEVPKSKITIVIGKSAREKLIDVSV